jgi:preprotein translocase subunit SecF
MLKQIKRKKATKKKSVQNKHVGLTKTKETSKRVEDVSLNSHKKDSDKLYSFYKKHHKKLLLIPIFLFLFCFVQLGFQYSTTGSFVDKGISLKGGSEVFIPMTSEVDLTDVQTFFNSKIPNEEINIRHTHSSGRVNGLIIESTLEDSELIKSVFLEKFPDMSSNLNKASVKIIGATLGENFFRDAIRLLILAFLCMGLVVFLRFRSFVPSIAVILSAVKDILLTVVILNLFGVKLTSSGIAALLMLIGYSVDTDILLATRLVKEKGESIEKRFKSAFKTGLTMTVTTAIAVLIALFFSTSQVLSQIMLIVFIGLMVDLESTWVQNASILVWYTNKKGKKE